MVRPCAACRVSCLQTCIQAISTRSMVYGLQCNSMMQPHNTLSQGYVFPPPPLHTHTCLLPCKPCVNSALASTCCVQLYAGP